MVIFHQEISTIDLGKEYYEGYLYMKRKDWVKTTKLECAKVQTDHRRRPFWQLSLLSFIEQNTYLNTGESLIKVIYVLKFRRNRVINNEECPRVQSDR